MTNKFGINHLSNIPIRETASHRSQMITQLLFGETFEILEQEEEWYKIRCLHDDYEGWMQDRQVTFIDEHTAKAAAKSQHFCVDMLNSIKYQDKDLPILIGSPIPPSSSYTYEQNTISPKKHMSISEKQAQLLKIGIRYLHAPYLWGGRSPFGLDCSGLVQVVYRMLGSMLPRDSSQQALIGTTIDFKAVQIGDLAFFKNAKGRITHVGIVWKNGQILHASAKVRMDILTEKGIVTNEGQQTHDLGHIQRIW